MAPPHPLALPRLIPWPSPPPPSPPFALPGREPLGPGRDVSTPPEGLRRGQPRCGPSPSISHCSLSPHSLPRGGQPRCGSSPSNSVQPLFSPYLPQIEPIPSPYVTHIFRPFFHFPSQRSPPHRFHLSPLSPSLSLLLLPLPPFPHTPGYTPAHFICMHGDTSLPSWPGAPLARMDETPSALCPRTSRHPNPAQSPPPLHTHTAHSPSSSRLEHGPTIHRERP